ncbi:ADP-ribosyltransferase [Bacteroides xylanisolvens]|uniref:ADP-ribosyltransferase n=1 Tax=Bacteroides xylanisolvens TaxID=371601 RepID=UPI001CDBF2B9|nr:ADP-ribosyltransferase [Bacteroides xylanisolvens]MCA4468128.1 hypothetical protein [Bacteroides xylanisolvens]MCA4472570.1 hypothetical protein [Bacteroides xylanisolvens]MCA4481720.1 hypothetical protein [Bacteroides xylanisolvens]MCA4521545.1 hypothetical protein [Bacteroides xylanisolvens]MCA4558109.1 hypothetical protein [Bacteroides xylanisolvens]
MAKKSDNDPRKGVLARVKRTEAYAERVRTLFAATVNEILALNKTMPELDEGEMFSFDAESMKKQREVERLLRQLHAVATMAIQSGIKLEWAAANAECDKLVQSCFGKRALNTPEFTAWTKRNEAAMAAFIARSEKGLNLSQRVWKSCRQLRDEMEVAITVAVGDGTSAASMSRSVRKYLNDPDLMFRRFRYKDPETGEWKRKWKKRVIGEDGKVHFIDYDKAAYQDEWTGPGYYKSSAQNAMRVARTETNIAYRRADHERWQQMDFVLGQRVSLSHNHPKKDICDKLAGDYPPDFVFDGWHPQCFCMVTPILMDEDEILKMNEAMLEGKEYKPRGKRITQYPDNFKEWVRDNEEKILASHDFGSDPYFVRNNFSAVQDILNPKKQMTPLEIAEQRHANRTPEQEEAIRLKWQERQERIAEEKRKAEAERLRIERINKTAQNVLKTATTRFEDFGLDTVALEVAVQSGDTAVINAETRALAQVMAKKQQQIKQTANNVISVTSKYKDFSVDNDAVTSLNDALKTGNLSAINAQTRALAQQIAAIKKQLQAMSSIIPNAQQWSDQFTLAEIQATHDAVQTKLASWSHLSLAEQAKKLKFEAIDFLGGNMKGVQQKYATWKLSQAAYLKRLDEVNAAIELEAQKNIFNQIASFASANPKSKNIQALVADALNSFANNDDISIIKTKVAAAQAYMLKLQAQQAKRAQKKALNTVSSTFDADAYSKERRDNAMWAKDTVEADARLRTKCGEVWQNAPKEERAAIHGYTEEYHNINEPLRGLTYIGSATKTARGLKRIPLVERIIDKSTYDFDMWVQRGDGMVALKKFGLANYNTATDAEIMALVGKTGVEDAFWSAGVAKGKGFSGSIIFNIYMPKGTKAMYCEPFSAFGHGSGASWDGLSGQSSFGRESEILIQRGTKFRVTKVQKGANGTWFIDLDVVEQNPVPFPYVGGYPFL